jgi:sugar phosphate isomerase/epimerase
MSNSPAISIQLYALHRQFDADPDGALEKLKAIGITNVEAFDFVRRPDELAERFSRHGISTPTGHAMLVAKEFTRDGVTHQVASHEVTFKAAQTLGMQYVIDPAVRGDWSDAAQVSATAAALNDAAREAADYGLRVGYHNHSWEINRKIGGAFALEVLAGQLDDGVILEVDLYWAYIGGADLPDFLGRLGERVKAVHFKDGPRVDDPFKEGLAPFDTSILGQIPAGQGDVPLKASLEVVPSLEFAVIEYDAYTGDIFEGIGKSYDYLKTLV